MQKKRPQTQTDSFQCSKCKKITIVQTKTQTNDNILCQSCLKNEGLTQNKNQSSNGKLIGFQEVCVSCRKSGLQLHISTKCQHPYCEDCLTTEGKDHSNFQCNQCNQYLKVDNFSLNKITLQLSYRTKSEEGRCCKCKQLLSNKNQLFQNSPCNHLHCKNCLATYSTREDSFCLDQTCSQLINMKKLKQFSSATPNKQVQLEEHEMIRCELCYKKRRMDLMYLATCGHRYCRRCIEQQFEVHCKNDKDKQLNCSGGNCDTQYSLREVHQHFQPSRASLKPSEDVERQQFQQQFQNNQNYQQTQCTSCKNDIQLSEMFVNNSCKVGYCLDCIKNFETSIQEQELKYNNLQRTINTLSSRSKQEKLQLETLQKQNLKLITQQKDLERQNLFLTNQLKQEQVTLDELKKTSIQEVILCKKNVRNEQLNHEQKTNEQLTTINLLLSQKTQENVELSNALKEINRLQSKQKQESIEHIISQNEKKCLLSQLKQEKLQLSNVQKGIESLKSQSKQVNIQLSNALNEINRLQSIIKQEKLQPSNVQKGINRPQSQQKQENIQLLNAQKEINRLVLQQKKESIIVSKTQEEINRLLSQQKHESLQHSIVLNENQELIQSRDKLIQQLIQQLQQQQGIFNEFKKSSSEELIMYEKEMENNQLLIANYKNDIKIFQESGSKLCAICLENKILILLEPCCHICICHDCSLRINKCPIDQKLITERRRVFLS